MISGQSGLLASELHAIERQKFSHRLLMEKNVVDTKTLFLIGSSSNQDRHKISDEYISQPHISIYFGVTCPWAIFIIIICFGATCPKLLKKAFLGMLALSWAIVAHWATCLWYTFQSNENEVLVELDHHINTIIILYLSGQWEVSDGRAGPPYQHNHYAIPFRAMRSQWW